MRGSFCPAFFFCDLPENAFASTAASGANKPF